MDIQQPSAKCPPYLPTPDALSVMRSRRLTGSIHVIFRDHPLAPPRCIVTGRAVCGAREILAACD
jgi:hypothetical protein